ncbi:MAG TPA: bacillithiol biosynthesis BshC [Gemmatimonadaceae bacterium]|nr:bacillithiol biosynthesis BshC [Gemmatimonadaceae bacterium]
MTAPVILTESLGGSALSRAARAGELPQWYPPVPRDAAAWARHAKDVSSSIAPGWYERLEPAFAATGAARDRLLEAARGNGLVITTGQQPGLFGGPLMTFVKALTARALADELQAMLGIPVAPVFWAATDDADFDEASVVSVALEGGAVELRLDPRAPAGTPMARVALDHDLDPLAAKLREACGSSPHASFLEMAERAYHDGATVGSAYVEVLRGVLEPLGIAVFDVSHPCVAAAGAEVLHRAARSADQVARAVSARSAEISAAGYAPQVDEVAGLSIVFLNEHGTKRRLSLKEAAVLGDLPDGAFLSSTVLMRPVLERSILPTAAYVGGPGEIAYFAQVSAVADAIGAPRPLVVPRWSTTIVEPRIQRLLDELGVTAGSLADVHAVEGRLARERMPADAARALDALRESAGTEIANLRRVADDLLPGPVFDGAQRSIEHRVARLERRLLAGVKRRETEIMRQLGTARGAIYPHGARQERKLAFVPFLARYGPALIDDMLAAAGAHARDVIGLAPTLRAAARSTAAAV